jgi:NAD+ synthase (glutamine-hydrolysing)
VIIALAQHNFHIGNFDRNTTSIIGSIQRAKREGADLVVFSELSVCGYPPLDLLEHRDFIYNCQTAIQKIASYSTGIAVIVGTPGFNPNPKGKNLYNSAYFLLDGEIKQIVHKTLLPTYDIFDEYRYFEPNNTFEIVEYKGEKIALTVCEDLWYEQPAVESLSRTKLYTTSPMRELLKHSPDLIINIAGSPFSYSRIGLKRNIFINNARKYQLPVIYVNQVGAQTELIFDGASMAVNAKGEVVSQLKYFDEDFGLVDTSKMQKGSASIDLNEISYIHDALVLGIKDYFRKMGFTKATLGLSGGIDSAVTLVLAERALGSENIRVLLMPSKYSSSHSVDDAVLLAKKLNIEYDIVGIEPMVESFCVQLKPVFGNLPPNVAEENIQARIRGILLMAVSNKFGHILLNTSNKSEAAVGYGTLYGDMNGGLSVLGDVYKTQVYKLAAYINRNEEIIPQNTITKPPSAELRPDQKDTDSLPEYDLLDKILYHYIECQETAAAITSLGIDAELVNRVIRMVNNNEYKRYQTPPILRISSKAFGSGRRMPLVAVY